MYLETQIVSTHAATIFLKAADYIRLFGWQEKGMGTHGHPRCSMGALESAHPRQTWNSQLALLMYSKLYQELNGITLTEFNRRAEDGEEVALLFEQVAAKLSG